MGAHFNCGGWLLSLVLVSAWSGWLGGCSTTALATQTAKGQWHELRTPRFAVWTDGDPELARSLVVDLERFHQLLRVQSAAEEREAAPPLRVFVAKDHATFLALTEASRELRGLFRVTMRGNYAIIDGTTTANASVLEVGSRTLLFHEYTHSMLAASGARVPSWYNEGLAEYMSTTEFRADGRYTVGCAPQYRAAWMKSVQWLPLQRVLEVDNVASLPLAGSPRQPSDSYAQSWYAVHYFQADPARKLQLNEYLKLWNEGVPPADAVQRAFKISVADLDRLLQGYAAQPAFECTAVAPAQPLTLPQVAATPLSQEAAQLHIADLLLATVGPTKAALDVLNQAAKQRPNDAATLLALGRAHWLLAERGDDFAADLATAKRYLEQAGKRASGSAEALALEGHVRRLQASSLAEAKEPFGDVLLSARKAYRAAIRADDALAEAYVGLGSTYLIEDNGSQEAQVALEAAAYLLPLDTEVALTLARIQIARSNTLQAVPALEYVVRWSKDDEQRNAARTVLEQLRGDAAQAPPAEAAPASDAAPASEAVPPAAPAAAPGGAAAP